MMDKYTKSWLTGFALGLCGKPLPIGGSKKEPVAYLYNGARLPKTPVVDGYDCATMQRTVNDDGSVAMASLYLSEMPLYRGYANNAITRCLKASASGSVIRYDINPENGDTDWMEVMSKTYNNDGLITSNYAAMVSWANYEVLNADGSVYRSPSDPVPVYE